MAERGNQNVLLFFLFFYVASSFTPSVFFQHRLSIFGDPEEAAFSGWCAMEADRSQHQPEIIVHLVSQRTRHLPFNATIKGVQHHSDSIKINSECKTRKIWDLMEGCDHWACGGVILIM